MDKGKEKQLTDAFFKQVGFLGNSEKAMEVISQQLGILFSELEVNTNSKLASMKAFLEHRGLILPNNFMNFINWHIYAYPDELDEKGLLAIKQEHIAEYCQIRTKELDAHLSKGNDNGTQPKGLSVDDILNNMFTLTSLELENLKNNLTKNDKQYISLNYIGTKKSLWEDLGKLLSTGIDRNEISRVFSEYCYWQKSTAGKSNKLEYDEIYKKIGRKVTKQG